MSESVLVMCTWLPCHNCQNGVVPTTHKAKRLHQVPASIEVVQVLCIDSHPRLTLFIIHAVCFVLRFACVMWLSVFPRPLVHIVILVSRSPSFVRYPGSQVCFNCPISPSPSPHRLSVILVPRSTTFVRYSRPQFTHRLTVSLVPR